jgi:hypothetical protein
LRKIREIRLSMNHRTFARRPQKEAYELTEFS